MKMLLIVAGVIVMMCVIAFLAIARAGAYMKHQSRICIDMELWDKLSSWAKAIHENACAHGWHDEKKPDDHWLCMVMTEVAEAVEADRKGRRFTSENRQEYEMRLDAVGDSREVTITAYESCIKGTLEEEFADIVIRILDFVYEKYGEAMTWSPKAMISHHHHSSFTESAFRLVRLMTYAATPEVLSMIVLYMYDWADCLGVDLDYHIVAKMKYNECRPYKHNNKKY